MSPLALTAHYDLLITTVTMFTVIFTQRCACEQTLVWARLWTCMVSYRWWWRVKWEWGAIKTQAMVSRHLIDCIYSTTVCSGKQGFQHQNLWLTCFEPWWLLQTWSMFTEGHVFGLCQWQLLYLEATKTEKGYLSSLTLHFVVLLVLSQFGFRCVYFMPLINMAMQ